MQYVERFDNMVEKKLHNKLSKWVGSMLSKRAIAKQISNTGLTFSDSGDRRQMRITQDFIGGKQLLIKFRNNVDLMSCWHLKGKTLITQITVSDDPVIFSSPFRNSSTWILVRKHKIKDIIIFYFKTFCFVGNQPRSIKNESY